MNRNDSSHSFRENYQEYILLQQKTAVLVDEYHDRKLYSDTKAAEGRRCLEHTKQLLNEMAEFVPLEGAVETVRDSISDIDKHNTDQNPYSSTIMELRKLDAKYDFDSLLDSDTPVSNSLLRSVQQHGRIMQAMPRKPSSSNGAAPNQTSWSVAPSFCDISNAPVVDVTKINSFADREAGTHARKHYHASTANLSEVQDSLNWVSFLIQREQFYTRSTRREMAAKAKAQEQQNREKGTQQDGLNTDADDNLLSHHLHKEDGGREEEGGDERDREGMENEDGGVEGEMKSPIPEAQRVLQEALGEISQDELLRNLYRQHLELQLPNPQRTADRVDEAEHVANLSSVIVDHFMRSVSHAVAENRAQEASVFEVTVQRAAVLRLQCLFRRSRARKQLQALRTQKRVMDALQVLMSELGRTDVKSLSIAQADIQAMEKIASTGGLGVGGRGGGGTGGAKCKGNNSGYNHSGASPSPSAGKLDFKNSASPYSSGASSERGYGSATRSYHSTPVSVDKWSSNSSGNGIYSSDSKSPDSPFYSDYKRTIGLPPSGSSSNVTNSGSKTNHTDHYSTSSSGYSNPVNISEITGVSSTGDSILPDEDECGASRGPSRSGSTTSSQLVITTALNTQANSSLALPLEIMNTNFISPKHATNVMVNVPDKVPGQAMATAVLPSKGILFATPLTEERSVSSREHAVGSSSVPEAVAPIRAADAATSVDASSAVQRFESPTITTGPSTNSSASNSLGTSTISSPIEIEIPRGRTRSEQEELQGESKANSVVPSPRDEEGQRGQRPLQPQQPLASGRSGRARK